MKNVLSLFNGMSVCAMALEDAVIEVDNIYISEIDKYANQASEALFPNQIQLGSVCDWELWNIDWSSIDLVTGGFPCQAWSMAGKQLGDKDERGMLFWTMLDIMKKVREHNPKAHFLIENVKMKKEFEKYITHHTEQALGYVHKILINSALVSAQNRNRYYWTSFPVTQPENKGVVLADILEVTHVDINVKCGAIRWRYIVNGKRADNTVKSMAGKTEQRLELRKDNKTNTLTTVQKDNVVVSVNSNDRVKAITENGRGYRPHKDDKSKSGISELGRILKPTANKTDTITTSHMPKLAVNDDINNLRYRKLTPRECMRLQTIPEHYIDKLLESGISNTQLYKMTGNGWTMKVISHILSEMPNEL